MEKSFRELINLVEGSDVTLTEGIGSEIRRKITGKVTGVQQAQRIARRGIKDALILLGLLEKDLYDNPEKVQEVAKRATSELRQTLKKLSDIE
jgi:hypothetical protein